MDPLLSIHQCPTCSRLVHFSHQKTTLLQCTCGSAIQRRDGVLLDKPFYLIQQHAAIIQPGTHGKWMGKSFKVLGRFRAWLNEAVFNYWTILFDDATIGYLGEGYGLYAVYQPTEINPAPTRVFLNGIAVGTQRDIYNGETFLLSHKGACYKWEIEGEVYLPESSPTFVIFEFSAQDGRHMEAFAFGKDHVEVFNVSYVAYSTLSLTNTRIWESQGKELRCEQCSRKNTVKTFPYAQSYACLHCGAGYVLEQSGSFTPQGQRNEAATGQNIIIGASALLKGIRYEVIGYALKEETNAERSQWKEYTLFNPEEGFAFLSEYNGNWIYVREQGDTPVLERDTVTEFTFGNEPFQLFNRYGYETLNAAGEFPYNLFNDDEKTVREFISPPEVWIQERSKEEGINWFLGEHISRKELEVAFGEAIAMPQKVGVGAAEPKGYVSPNKIAVVAFAAILVLVLAHIASTVGLENRIIGEAHYSFDSLSNVSAVTPKFQLNKWRSNLQIDVEAPVDNSWFELNATLVNVGNGTEYSLEKGVEYYHGYSEGESWAEGSTRGTAYLNRIPAGTYYLQINGTREVAYGGYASSAFRGPDGFYLTITYDTPNHRNLVICLIALLILSIVQYQVVQFNENKRWSNSPFSPYDS